MTKTDESLQRQYSIFLPLKRLINMIFSAQTSVLQVRPFVIPFRIILVPLLKRSPSRVQPKRTSIGALTSQIV